MLEGQSVYYETLGGHINQEKTFFASAKVHMYS